MTEPLQFCQERRRDCRTEVLDSVSLSCGWVLKHTQRLPHQPLWLPRQPHVFITVIMIAKELMKVVIVYARLLGYIRHDMTRINLEQIVHAQRFPHQPPQLPCQPHVFRTVKIISVDPTMYTIYHTIQNWSCTYYHGFSLHSLHFLYLLFILQWLLTLGEKP